MRGERRDLFCNVRQLRLLVVARLRICPALGKFCRADRPVPLRVGTGMNSGCGWNPGEGVTRSPRLLRERVLHAAGSELAAAVTRSHPASLLARTAKRTRTDGEQNVSNRTSTVLMPMNGKSDEGRRRQHCYRRLLHRKGRFFKIDCVRTLCRP